MSDNNSTDNCISIDGESNSSNQGLKYLPHWPPVNLEFDDIVYSVGDDESDSKKVILRGVSGSFRSGQLAAILGPSGAGKTSLLNILAGYKCSNASGTITVNGQERDMSVFRKMSRYILQQDIYPKFLTVREAMLYAADLKLGNDLTKLEKHEVIEEIVHLLRLDKAIDTMANRLSGGERKRLSIALELVNNPPVLFLDEPTTGLDDLSSSQCISLLRRIAHEGRTVICSIHTPSAKIFEMFDHVYIVSNGRCVYQGQGQNIVPYLKNVGFNCPKTYNPADFIIEVSSGEYGNDCLDKMVSIIDNGRIRKWTPSLSDLEVSSLRIKDKSDNPQIEPLIEEINKNHLKAKCTSFQQFCILVRRMSKQIYRNKSYLLIKLYMHIFLGFVIGGLFFQMGNDATKTLFNFGFCFTIIIAFMYIPMMPVLLEFPSEVEVLKREYFNRYYRLHPFFFAMHVAKLPVQLMLALLYLSMVYLITDQPLEMKRVALFYFVSLLVFLTSESLGLLVASRLSVVNGMFVGPVCTVPLMLLAVFGIGSGKPSIPIYVRLLMSLSYLRYGLEGIVESIYGFERTDLICPEDEIFCPYKKPKFLLLQMGFEDVNVLVCILALIIFYSVFNFLAFYLIKQRISLKSKSFVAVQYIGRLLKKHLNFQSLD